MFSSISPILPHSTNQVVPRTPVLSISTDIVQQNFRSGIGAQLFVISPLISRRPSDDLVVPNSPNDQHLVNASLQGYMQSIQCIQAVPRTPVSYSIHKFSQSSGQEVPIENEYNLTLNEDNSLEYKIEFEAGNEVDLLDIIDECNPDILDSIDDNVKELSKNFPSDNEQDLFSCI